MIAGTVRKTSLCAPYALSDEVKALYKAPNDTAFE